MHRLDYMIPLPTKPRVPFWVFFALLTLNVGVAVYCLTHDRHVFTAIGGALVGGTLLWNFHRALNHDEISAGSGRRPMFTRAGSPVGYWVSFTLYAFLYVLCLVIPPLVRYSDSR